MANRHSHRSYKKMDSDDPDIQDACFELPVRDGQKGSGLGYAAVPANHSDFQIRPGSPHLGSPDAASTTSRISGWRGGAMSAAALAFVSLAINLGIGIWLRYHPGSGGSLTEVYRGDCKTAKDLGVWVHLAINIISTLLLGGSNYCMQCVSAPTRKEIDKAHSEERFLDIGVPSYRNLKSVAVHKMIMWWILGLSSIPLHLMYNSAFYASLAQNDYSIVIVTPAFLTGGVFNVDNLERSSTTISQYNASYDVDLALLQSDVAAPNTSYQRLETNDCIGSYAQVFLADRRNLVIVASNTETNNSLLTVERYESDQTVGDGIFSPYDWICRGNSRIYESKHRGRDRVTCDSFVSEVEAAADEWEPWGFTVEYCLSEQVPESCSFNGNLPIIFIVVACNIVKFVIMLIVAFALRGSPLITLGDALESFLRRPDVTTEGLCLLSRKDVPEQKYAHEGTKPWPQREYKTRDYGQIATVQRHRWSSAATSRRWVITIGLTAVALFTVVGLLAIAIQSVAKTTSVSIWSMGFGAINGNALISGWDIQRIPDASNQVLASVLVANLPQTILSFLYLNINGLFTSMFLAAEWSDFATERKTLRVSSPKGNQRSRHFLQLPYRAGVPLMILSGLLHWLVSQSIFLAVVAQNSPHGDLMTPVSIATCGFSPIAMFTVLMTGIATIAATLVLGRFRYNAGIPLVGSCSVAIAAACHRPAWDVDAHLSPVQWGAVPGVDVDTGVGHCCFTSGDVEPVQEGKKYAARIKKD